METNESIVEHIQAGDADAMSVLWTANEGLVAYIANRYNGMVCERGDCDFDDLMQAGFIGLFKAARVYAPDKGAKFSTFCVFFLRREMRRALGILTSKRDPSMGAFALDAPLYDDVDKITLLDTMATAEPEECPVEREELVSAVHKAVERIEHPTVRRAIEAYYFNGQDTVQQAEAEGVTHASIGNRLCDGYRALYNDPELRSWANDYGYINEYRHKGVAAFKSSFSSVVEDIVMERESRAEQKRSLSARLGALAGRGNAP